MSSRLRARRAMMLGYMFALGAAFAYGTTQFLARKLVTDVASPLVAASFGILFGALMLAVASHRSLPGAFKAPGKTWVFIVGAGVFGTAGAVAMFFALRLAPVVMVSPIVSVNPLIAILLSHLFLQKLERVTLRILAGAVMVVLGVSLVILGFATN